MASLDQIVQAIDVEGVFADYGIRAKRSRGDQHNEANCPLCEDDSHFGFETTKGLWQCWKCGETGNLVSLVEKVEKCTPRRAYEILHEKADLPLEKRVERKAPPAGKSAVTEEEPPEDMPSDDDAPEDTSAVRMDDAMDSSVEAIFSRFVELSHLKDEERQHLKDERGFSDETIDALMFRSGGDHNTAVVAELQREFPAEDLVRSGMFTWPEGQKQIAPSKQLFDRKILIPYLNKNDRVYHLRRHKLGFAGVSPQIYCRRLLREEERHVILAEAEFKAAACWQWNLPAISIPGISAFGQKYFSRLTEFLREHGVERVTVVFDNEIKDNPSYPNYKAKEEDRYDTDFWAYMMAYKLGRQGFQSRIGTLPEDWMDNGKIDFDMALAQGRSREDIIEVVRQAKTHTEYLADFDERIRGIINRKKARHFEVSRVRRNFYKYHIAKDEYEKQVSNFVMDIKASFHTSDGIVRSVEFVNEFGERSEPFMMDSKVMVSLTDFRAFCLGKGNFLYEGSGTDLTEIWKYELLRDTGEVIRMPERIGRISEGFWMFGNLAIKDGKVYYPDESGIIWIDSTGYKAQSLVADVDGAPPDLAMPNLHAKSVDIGDIAFRLKESVGGYEAWAALGWVAATVFSEDIFKAYKAMPILFAHGAYEAGKTTLMRWIMAFFGIEHAGANIGETTQNFIMRALAYWSSLPVWFDEFRNERDVQSKSGFFRSAYNRQSSGKGVKQQFGARGYRVNATLALSGQEMPMDAAFASRLVTIRLTSRRREREHFDWLNARTHEFSGWVFHLIENYDHYLPIVLKSVRDLKHTLVATGLTDRTAENWAIIGGAFWATVQEDNEFIKWLQGAAQEVQDISRDEEMVSQFWADISVLHAEGQLGRKQLKVTFEQDGTRLLHVWFAAVYNIWASDFRRRTGREPFEKVSVLKQIEEQSYWVGSARNLRINGIQRRAMTINVELASEVIQEVATAIEDADEKSTRAGAASW